MDALPDVRGRKGLAVCVSLPVGVQLIGDQLACLTLATLLDNEAINPFAAKRPDGLPEPATPDELELDGLFAHRPDDHFAQDGMEQLFAILIRGRLRIPEHADVSGQDDQLFCGYSSDGFPLRGIRGADA